MKNKQESICVTAFNGSKSWWLNNKLHREDGPAYERTDGYKEWWLNNIKYTEEEYYKELFKRGKITKKELFIELI